MNQSNEPKEKIPETTNADANRTKGLAVTMHKVYLTKADFVELLNVETVKKVVFKFYFPDTAQNYGGSPTLAAWASQKKNDFLPPGPPHKILRYGTKNLMDLPANICMGDQELEITSDIDRKIREASCTSNECVFVFVPQDDEYLYYKIFIENRTEAFAEKDYTSLASLAATNPSPPRNAS